MKGADEHEAHLIRFDLADGAVLVIWSGKRNGRLTQEQDLDRPGVLTSDSLLVELLVNSVGPLLCLLLRP